MSLKFFLLLLLVVPSCVILTARAQGEDFDDDRQEDTIEGEDIEDDEGDATVEADSDTIDTQGSDTATVADSEMKDEEEEEDSVLRASPDADTHLLFTKPTVGTDLPAGQVVAFLIGFTNNADKDFVVESLDASFRYPQDYSYYIQNFTQLQFDRTVEPERQATFQYAFTPNEAFSSRPFGLTINLNYKDTEGNYYQDAVFNETVNIVEADEGLDGETFFLYVFLAAAAILFLVGAQQLLSSFSKKKSTKAPVERGTQGRNDVDYDWIPKETLDHFNRSPRSSPRQSPGRRRVTRSSGSSDD